MASGSVNPAIRIASAADLGELLPLVRAYHDFEGILLAEARRHEALARLLGDSSLGRVLVSTHKGELIGYTVLCFGYSIEFGGRDAFIDELYVAAHARGVGVGVGLMRAALEAAQSVGAMGVHLEVAQSNRRARELYQSFGFAARDQFNLMSLRLDEN